MFQNLTMQIEFPQGFKNKFQELLGEEFPLLESCLYKRPKECIRVNTLKISKEELKERLERKGWKLEEVPWYENAFFVETQESIAKTKEFFLGYYYIQDAASLVPVIALDPKPGEAILDACASPGSKTTFIAELMKNEGLIVANDVNPKSIKALSFNIQKIGARNVVVTMMDARNIKELNMKFDKILLDVPCSASGTFISSFRVLEFWSQHVVERLSNLQKQLLRAAVEVLKEGGTLVYSTCSMDPEEDEENMEYAIKKLGLKQEKIELSGDETYLELEEKLVKLGGKVLREIIIDYLDGKIKTIPQDESKATYTKKISKEDGFLSFDESYEIWQRKIRALNPWPSTYIKVKSENDFLLLKIFKIEKLNEKNLPKEILKKNVGEFFEIKNDLGLRLKDAFVILQEVQLEGRKKMSGREFLNGFRKILNIN